MSVRPAGLAVLALLTALVPRIAPAEGRSADDASTPVLHSDVVPQGPSVAVRLAQIQQRVQQVAEYPPIARERSIEGEAQVSFRVGTDGSAEGVRTERSSGSVALDRAAERAVLEADRLPYVYGRVVVPVVFQLRDPQEPGTR